ncbi:nitrate reductase associated protein, partial [Komagataeibacter swingsii]
GHLSVLQRFALLKLTRPGHENQNFEPALREFLGEMYN